MRYRYKLPVIGFLLLCFGVLGVLSADASTVKRQNLGDLIALGDIIIRGHITNVTDGIDANNVPYTEVTVNITETLRGNVTGTYAFRQFGLLQPRDMGNGLVNLNTTLDGWARYAPDEEVVLFLYQAAPWTGLRTTVGLFQGKFTIEDGQVANIVDNEGLFENLSYRMGTAPTLDPKTEKMLQVTHGSVSEDVFMSFVRTSVQQNWFVSPEGGR